jgi:hypothetical protein
MLPQRSRIIGARRDLSQYRGEALFQEAHALITAELLGWFVKFITRIRKVLILFLAPRQRDRSTTAFQNQP